MAHPLLQRSPSSPPTSSLTEEASSCFGALWQAPGLGLAYLDRELCFRSVSPGLITLSGLPGVGYEGQTPGEVWPGMAASLAPLLGRALAGEAVMGARLFGSLGPPSAITARHYRVNLLPAGTGGARAGVTLMLEDETERVEKERAVRESEERLRGIVAVSCDGYALHEAGKILEMSPSLARLFGSTPEEMSGQNLGKWIAPESREVVGRAMAQNVVAPYELTGLRSDGKRLYLEALAQSADYRGRPVRMVTLWDISARKAAEEVSSRADVFREQMMGVVGTELRSPVYALQLSTAALQRGGELSDEQSRQVGHVAAATRRLDWMLRELVDFTRTRLGGGLTLHPVSVSLEGVLTRVVEQYRAAHPQRRLVSVLEGDPWVTWDETRFTQLLEHLLSNALRPAPVGGLVELKVSGTPDDVTLSVRNEGPPVPLEDRPTLFEPFKRGKRLPGEGLGLGLYLARQIALAHGGRISVETGTGVGTRFVTCLPRHAPGT